MKTGPILAELHPPGKVFLCLSPCRVNGPVGQLDFQRAIEKFGESVIVADASAADRLPDIEAFQDAGELGRGIITSAVAVEYCSFRQVQVPGCHLDRLADEGCLVIIKI
jgi:hypothetical protein